MATDKKTIGITRDNNEVLQRLVIDGQFGSELDAAKFAMARAIKKGTEPGRIDSADTKWNVGSVDVDGKTTEPADSILSGRRRTVPIDGISHEQGTFRTGHELNTKAGCLRHHVR